MTALGYYADYKDEIDWWIERNAALADEAEVVWRRSQSSTLTA